MIISNSQVQALTCPRKHYYAHELGLAPKQYPDHLFRGIIGHEALAEYYKVIKLEGWAKKAEAKKAALDFVFKMGREHVTQLHVVGQVADLLVKYFNRYREDNFNVLLVEEYFEEQRDGFPTFGMRLDLLLEMKVGPYRGQLLLSDHKFTYNFKSQTLLELDPQFPKYIGTLRRAGYPVTRAMVNQIRTREWGSEKPSDRFKRVFPKYSDEEIANVESDHNVAAERIAEARKLPLAIRSKQANRLPGPQNCNYCDFTDICLMERQDKDITRTVAAHYRKNPYGYGK